MIIDADVHLSPTPEQGLDASVETTLKKMEKAGVDKALVWLIPPYLREIDAGNAYVHQAMRSHPGKFLGFGWADPNLGVDKARDAVKQCVYEYGLCGVKLNGAQNSFYIDDPKLSLPVIEEIARTGKILAFHVGTDAFEFTHPFRVGKIAKLYPELQILAVHMGGVGHADVTNAMIETASQCPNITLIGSAVRMPAVWKAITTLGASRVCFGSDTPFDIMHAMLGAYRALIADLPEQDRGLILGGNIARLFGL